MGRSSGKVIGGFAGAVALTIATITGAHAEYLGYDNGDPGNWDFATEQAGGPCGLPGSRAVDPATGQAKCCAQYNPESACPFARTGTRYYRHSRHNSRMR